MWSHSSRNLCLVVAVVGVVGVVVVVVVVGVGVVVAVVGGGVVGGGGVEYTLPRTPLITSSATYPCSSSVARLTYCSTATLS